MIDLEAIEAAWSGVGPGPEYVVHRFDQGDGSIRFQVQATSRGTCETGVVCETEADLDNPHSKANAEAIAWALEHVPALVARVRELEFSRDAAVVLRDNYAQASRHIAGDFEAVEGALDEAGFMCGSKARRVGEALAELRAHRDALDRIENAMRTLTVGAGSIEMKAKIRGIIEEVRG